MPDDAKKTVIWAGTHVEDCDHQYMDDYSPFHALSLHVAGT